MTSGRDSWSLYVIKPLLFNTIDCTISHLIEQVESHSRIPFSPHLLTLNLNLKANRASNLSCKNILKPLGFNVLNFFKQIHFVSYLKLMMKLHQ